MTLQEKIQKEAEGYGSLAPAFLEGAKFALENQWISVEDDLPCNHEELVFNSQCPITRMCVVCNEHFIGTNRMFKNDGKWEWGIGFQNVLEWFPVPKHQNKPNF